MQFNVDITVDGTVAQANSPEFLAEDLLTYLTSGGALAYPAWIFSVDGVDPVVPPPPT